MSSFRLSSTGRLNELFKSSMARVASQAMILTGGVSMNDTGALHGLTLSSVSSLSVYPKPLLQFNLHLPSYTSKTIHENEGLMAIHLMQPTFRGSKIGRIFAKGVKRNDGRIFPQGETKDGEFFHEMTTPFHRLSNNDWKFMNVGDKYKVPILNDSERVFLCKKYHIMEVENHEIWVVNVVDVIVNTKVKTGGLLYFDRRFHRIGESINE